MPRKASAKKGARRASTGKQTPRRTASGASNSTPSASSSSSSSSSSSNSNSNSVVDTPIRQLREEERKEFGKLNKRLEFYILNQREVRGWECMCENGSACV
jgi:hypothetical protein